MSHRPRRLLPAFALGAAVTAVVAAGLLVGLGGTAPEAAGAATFGPPAQHPEHQAPRAAPRYASTGERAARIALEAVGVPYRWGGTSPASGFDCSGLVRWAYLRVGIDLPHSSYALYGEGRRVGPSGMRAGDLLFFEGLGHVAVYLGRGRMVHAPQTGRNVEVVGLARSNYGGRLIAARRVVPA